ncbi:plexin-A4-like [Ptychodera flava]|uniref:plexin-A4-like n=1 Tax=Ptychodera flava TaxID=63121 RepID=UPI00396A5DC6
MSSDALVLHTDTLVMSIAVTIIERHTVAFLGTNDGRLMKVHITSSTQSNIYEELSVAVGGGSILSDMEFDPTHRHVYVPTAKEVLKMRVEDCSQYESCTEYFGSLDPYCGWCTLERRCSMYSDCPRSNKTSRWLDVFSNSSCVSISNIDPENSIPITVRQKITLTVVELPSLLNHYQYKCVFGDSFMTVAEKYGSELTCDTPHIDQRPDIPEGAVRKFAMQLCSDCVTSDWACNWCVYENRCTHYQQSCPEDDQTSIVIGTNNRFNHSDIKGQSFCPQLDRQDSEVLIPAKVEREIHIKTLNVYYKDEQSYYECILTVEGILQSSPATRINESLVICNMRKYHYDASVQEMIVPLSLKMNGNYIDDIYGYKVTLYDCSIDRRDCSHCLSELTTRLPLQCGWCKGSGTCEVQELCTNDEWLPYETTESCDDPVITEVWPLSGPYEGNTDLLVRGNNLGKRFSDIEGIEVGALPCTLIEAAYSVSESVMCTTTRSERPNVSGHVVVHIIQAKSARSSQDFTYRDPTIHDFTPKVGPKSGGTTVTITGEFIDAGRNITADFDGFPCLVRREQDVWNETTVRCKTSSVDTTQLAKLRMHFDGTRRFAPDGKVFNYTEDPTVKSINPSRSMQSGGRQFNVTGTMFTSVLEPRMVLSCEDEIFVGQPCQVYSQSSMQCLSPAVYSGDLAGAEYDMTVGFLMDAVEDLLQLDLDFTVVSDPVYFEFLKRVILKSNMENN